MNALEVPSHTRREWIDAYVKRSWVAKLAPLVEWIADWLDRRAGVPPPCAVRHWPVARKVLAFDYNAIFLLFGALLFALFAASEGIGGDILFESGLLAYICFLLLGFAAILIGGAFALAHRLCQLRRLLARCVAVTARVVAADARTGEMEVSASPKVEYVYAGVLYTSYLSVWPRPSHFVGSAPELLVDTQNPRNVLIRDFYTDRGTETAAEASPPSIEARPPSTSTSPAGTSPNTPPSPPSSARGSIQVGDRFDPARLDGRAVIARYADGKLFARLAPLVEWIADRIGRPAPLRDAIPRAPSQGQLRLEPVARKVLAFDAHMVAPGAGLSLFAGLYLASITDDVLTKGHAQPWVLVSIFCAPFFLWLLGYLYLMAVRLRTLRRLLATCAVVVPSRVTRSYELDWGEGYLEYRVAFEYWYAGKAYRYSHVYKGREYALIGETPELVVPTSSPETALIRDFYT